MTLREKLIVSRNKAGLSQMELAERLGVSRQAVSRWESGDTTPTMDKLKALAKLYGVSLDWLFGDTADGEPPEAAKPEADRNPDEAPAGKEGEKKQKIRAIAIALAIVVIAFIWHKSPKIVCSLRTASAGVLQTWKDTDHRKGNGCTD